MLIWNLYHFLKQGISFVFIKYYTVSIFYLLLKVAKFTSSSMIYLLIRTDKKITYRQTLATWDTKENHKASKRRITATDNASWHHYRPWGYPRESFLTKPRKFRLVIIIILREHNHNFYRLWLHHVCSSSWNFNQDWF